MSLIQQYIDLYHSNPLLFITTITLAAGIAIVATAFIYIIRQKMIKGEKILDNDADSEETK